MSTPGQGSILGSPIIYGKVDYGPTHGQVYRPLNQKRLVTAAGTDTVQPFDQTIIYKKTVPAAFQVILPDVRVWMTAPYGGFDLIFIDGVGNAATYPITFVPFSTQTIDGATGNITMNTNSGTLIFVPLIDKTGWTLIEAWPSSGSSSADPPDTSVQFNDGGAFGGQANFTFIKGTGLVSLPSLEVQTGNVSTPDGAGVSDNGISLIVIAGDGGSTSGNGGPITVLAGSADGAGAGGDLSLLAGTGVVGNGGNISVASGDVFGAGNSGTIDIIAGIAHGAGFGGPILLEGGTAQNGPGGSATVAGGVSNGGGGIGGDVILSPGHGNGAGRSGYVTINSGLSNFADDAAAAVGGVPINGLYRTASAVKIRVT